MSDIAILKEMLTDAVIVPLTENEYGKKRITLTENNAQIRYSVVIDGMPDEVVVIKTDTVPAPKNLFCNSKGECKRADFTIVADTGTRKVILFIEMKAQANTSRKSEIIQQLNGSRCLIHYCQAIGQIFWKEPDFLINYEHRFIKIVTKTTGSIRKQGSRSQSEIHDEPEKMLTMTKLKQNLKFNQLVGK